jgi:hypothetical protein
MWLDNVHVLHLDRVHIGHQTCDIRTILSVFVIDLRKLDKMLYNNTMSYCSPSRMFHIDLVLTLHSINEECTCWICFMTS